MKRRVLALGCLGVMGLVLAACGKEPEAPPAERPVGTAPPVEAQEARPLAGPAALAEAQLPDFVTEIERLVNGAAERVIAQGSGAPNAPGPLRVTADRRVPDGDPLEREFDVTAAGQSGNVRAFGHAFTRPWPARYDMSMLLAELAEAPTLTADGALQYNFIRDDRAAPVASHGLFRARLALSGAFAGDVDLHGEIAAGKIVSLVVLTGGSRTRLRFGARDPRPIVSYVSTVVGTGEEGNRDGPAREAQLNGPAGVLVGRDGRLFIADTKNDAVREVSPAGEVTTLSTAFDEPWDLGLDGLGLLVVSDRASSTKEDRGPISRVVTGGELRGLVIRTIRKAGQTVAGFPLCSQFACDGRSPMAAMQWAAGIDVDGGVVMATQWALPEGLRLVTPDGAVLTLRSWSQGVCTPDIPGGPYDIARGPKGVLYFTTDCHAVWALRNGVVELLAGTPGTALGFADGVGGEVKFSYPSGLVTDGEHLYVTETTGNFLRRIDPKTGETLRIAGCRSHVEGFECNDGHGFRDGPGDYAQFDKPQNLALDPWGDIYIADSSNNAIRFVRLASDPERRPVIDSIQPLGLLQGAAATLTLRGRELGLARTVELGDGIAAEIVERSAKKLKVRVQVAENAPAGAHALTLTTPFGRTAASGGMALNVLGERASRAQVRTIAGTGDWAPSVDAIVPADQSKFAFPGGIAAIDRERLLIADPLENRVRLLATKNGAARELLEIAAYEAGGQTGMAILQGIEGFENIAGNVLDVFGVDNFTEEARGQALAAIEAGLDEICEAAGSDCEYLSLPWAGAAGAGDSGGFRLNARLFLPTDVALAGDDKFLIADSGNRHVKTVGIDFSGPEPKDAPFQVADTDDLQDYPLAVVSTAADTGVAATSTDSTLAKITLRDGSSVLSAFAGVRNAFRCERRDGDVRQPLGVPMGMASGKSGTFIADPYCATIWRLDANGEAQDIRGSLTPMLTPLPKCADGPLVFATFSTPMDVAVDSQGNVWVADSGCNSIRVVKPVGVADARAFLDQWAGGISDWLDEGAAARVAGLIGDQSLGEYDAARMWVTTVAGAADGEAGFRDGAASESLFNAPVSVAVAEEDDKTYVFVSDVGNKRIRLIDLSAQDR